MNSIASSIHKKYKQFENEITLPLYTKLTDEEVDYIIENYCNVINKVKN